MLSVRRFRILCQRRPSFVALILFVISSTLNYHWRGRRGPSQSATCVVSVVIGDKFSRYQARIVENKQRYCQIRGFECMIYTKPIKNESRPLAWQKLYAIDEALHATQGRRHRCDRVIWVDADAFFVSTSAPPGEGRLADVLLSRDPAGINTGVVIIRNTPWADQFFHKASEQTQFNEHPWWEQAAIQHLVDTSERGELRGHISYVPQRLMNWYSPFDAPFIYHSAGCASKIRHGSKQEQLLRQVALGVSTDEEAGQATCERMWDVALNVAARSGIGGGESFLGSIAGWAVDAAHRSSPLIAEMSS